MDGTHEHPAVMEQDARSSACLVNGNEAPARNQPGDVGCGMKLLPPDSDPRVTTTTSEETHADMSTTTVTVKLTSDEALVLFELLQRFSTTDTLLVEHRAEEVALCSLTNLLERELGEPFRTDYDQLLTAARERLSAGHT